MTIENTDTNSRSVIDNPVVPEICSGKRSKDQNFNAVMALIACGLFFGSLGYYLGERSVYPDNVIALNEPVITQKPTSISAPKSNTVTLTPTSETSFPTITTIKGANLADIKYTLPESWYAKILNDALHLSPISGGGFLSITSYPYENSLGRREYYCEVRKTCIKKTYFESVKLGNIDGYIANAIDNSGGGSEYFGAKGDNFYVIAVYIPPSPNDFNDNYRKVLSTLRF